MKGWGLPVRRAATLVVAALIAVAGLTAVPSPAAAANCTDAQLVPKLHEFAVLQGLPSYARLARHKDFLAKLFLSLPTCATGTAAEIQLQSGSTLAVNGTAHVAMSPPPSGPFPSLAPESAAPAPDTTGDPRWLVPGNALAASPLSPLGTTITATVRYKARLSSSASFSDVRTATFNTSVQVDRETKALKVLFVTMGDAGKTAQFSSSATKALGQGIDALARLFPVASGVAVLGTPAAATAGVAHAVDGGMLNLGAGPGGLNVMPGGKFCGDGGNFDQVAGGLGGFLTAWNQANPDAKAERVIGLVDQAVSGGVASGCAEGMAQVDGAVGWVRVVYDRNGNSTFTGALLGMELGHTLGLSAPTLDDGFHHSRNVEADVTSPNRAYDIRLARYLPDDHTVMRFSGTWNDGNVLLERDDWAWAQCRLGGLSTSCLGAGTPVGGVAAAGPRFVLDALVHRSHGGSLSVDVLDAELRDGSSDDTTSPDPQSEVRLRFEDGDGATLSEEGVPVELDETHGDDGADDHTGTIHVARPFDGSARRWKLLQGDRVLAEREVGAPPEITGTDSRPDTATDEVTSVEPWTATAEDEARPALAAGLLAWTTPGGVFVTPVDDPATATPDDGWSRRVGVPGTAGAASPALDHAGTRLAYETAGGDIAVATVSHDPATGEVSIGPSQVVYNAALTVLQRPAHHPTLTADGNLVIEVEGNLYLIALEPNPLDPLRCALSPVLPCRQLTTGGGASGPSASPTSTGVAYAKGGDVRVVDSGSLLDRLLVAGGREPAWGGQPGAERLAFTRDGADGPDLWLTDPGATVPGNVAQRLTRLGADSHPGLAWAPAGGVVAVERGYANPDHRELVLVRVAPNDDPSPTRTIYTTTAVDDRPDELRARFYRECGDGRLHPFGWGVAPIDVDGREAHFEVVFDAGSNPADTCPDGDTRHEVSDGALRDHEDVQGAPELQDRPPVVWVAGALEGATFRQGQAVVIACAGRDPDGGALPASALAASLAGPQPAVGGATLVVVPVPGSYVATCTGPSGVTATASFRVLGPQVLVLADFDPDVLWVPPDPSEAKTVTIAVQPPTGRDLRDVAASTVQLSTIGGHDVSGDDRFKALEWSVVRTSGGGHQGVAKIDRLTLARYLEGQGMVERHVSVGIVGEAPEWGFAGEDEPLIRSR